MCVGPINTLKQGIAEAELRGQKAGQILFNTKIKTEQTAQLQDRRRGATRAASAKQGVKVKGTTKRLIEEQIKQDELELLKVKFGGEFAAKGEVHAAASSINKATSAAVKETAQLIGLA